MLYLFAGDDAASKLAAYENFLRTASEGAETFFVNKNDFDLDMLRGFYTATNLFAARSVVVLHDMLEEEDTREAILPELAAMEESKNMFIFSERKLPKAVIEAFKKARAEINIYEAPKDSAAKFKAGKGKFDNFRIANAFAMKDKFNTWLYFRQAVERGAALEEIVGILFWKIKDMLLKKNFSKFKEEDLKTYAARISYLLPEARTKGPEAEAALEQFLLEAF